MNRLLALHGSSQQEDLFEKRNERLERAIAQSNKCINRSV